jgi:two-component system, NtrC family, response regulator AtoC
VTESITTRPLPDRHASRTSEAPATGRAFVFVCGPDACWVADLPAAGEVVVGRAADATLRLDDDSVSRQHARLAVTQLVVTATDLGSANGTCVNGERLEAPRLLAPGDIVEIGVYKLVFSIERPAVGAHAIAEPGELQRRLLEEIERSDDYGRSCALAVVRFDPAIAPRTVDAILAAELRPIELAAWTGPHELAIVLPELDAGQAGERVARLGAALRELDPTLRAGWAVCPDDGGDEAALLGGARAAALASTPGAPTSARQAVRRIAIGERTILVAEPAMLQLYALVERLAASDVPVLIRGETGSGKDLVAAALHHGSRRKTAPFIAINCAALPEQLVESELFGHDKGAFTGATEPHAGAFEAAHGGTLFLDEIGELPAAAQAKLLRVVESQEVARVGSHKPRKVDVRIVAATNRDPSAEIAAGRFRQDLYFRLCGGLVTVPPLRERRREIPIFATTFLDDACRRLPRESIAIAGATMLELIRHDWPGNVRELRQLMEYLAAACPDPVLEPWHLADRLAPRPASEPEPASDRPLPRFRPLHEEIADLERDRITVALAATGGVQARAAALIGMPLRTFITKLKRYNIKPR